MSPQIPLSLKFPPDQRLEAFEGQADLRELVDAVARGAREDWLYLSGPSGSGKSHLQLAACARARECSIMTTYLPLAATAGRLADALAGHSLQAGVPGWFQSTPQPRRTNGLVSFPQCGASSGARRIYSATALPWRCLGVA